MEKILADTSAWVNSFSRTGYVALKQIMKDAIMNRALVTTGMVLLELLRGTRNPEQFEALRKQMSILPMIPAQESIWLDIARFSISLRDKGVQVPIPDVFIAHIAITHDCLLVHCDRDFERIAQHSGLKARYYV